MTRRFLGLCATLVALLVGAAGAQAQVFTPTYTSPRLLNDLGIYVSDGPGELALEGIWRSGPLGLRVGFADVGDGALTLGAELRNPLPMAGAPLGLALVFGVQGVVGDVSGVGAQAGLSAGYTARSGGLALTPYIHPRIAVVNNIGGADDFELDPLADIGFDVEFAQNLLLRFGITLGDVGSSWGVGLAWRR